MVFVLAKPGQATLSIAFAGLAVLAFKILTKIKVSQRGASNNKHIE